MIILGAVAAFVASCYIVGWLHRLPCRSESIDIGAQDSLYWEALNELDDEFSEGRITVPRIYPYRSGPRVTALSAQENLTQIVSGVPQEVVRLQALRAARLTQIKNRKH